MLRRLSRTFSKRSSSKNDSEKRIFSKREERLVSVSDLRFNDDDVENIFKIVPILIQYIRLEGIQHENLFDQKCSSFTKEFFRTCWSASRYLISCSSPTINTFRLHNIQIWAIVLKWFLLEIKFKLFPPAMTDYLLMSETHDELARVAICHREISSMPLDHQSLLQALFTLLGESKCPIERVASIFGEILFMPANQFRLESKEMLNRGRDVTSLATIMVTHRDDVFRGHSGTEEIIQPAPKFLKTEPELISIGSTVVALCDSKTTQPGEMHCVRGEEVIIRDVVDRYWYYGEKISSGQPSTGIFPKKQFGGVGSFNRSVPVSDTPAKKPTRNHCSIAQVLVEYESQNYDEINLTQGDFVYIYTDVDENWYFGTSEKGEAYGYFPKKYVRISQRPSIQQASSSVTNFENSSVDDDEHESEVEETKTFEETPRVHVKSKSRDSDMSNHYPIDSNRYAFCMRFFSHMCCVDRNGVPKVSKVNAIPFLMKSSLGIETVSQIFRLADVDMDDALTAKEFVIAHHLALSISREGMLLPDSLPSYLRHEVQLV